MARTIITNHWQGSQASIGAIGTKSPTTLYVATSGDARPVKITRFDVMSAATYAGLAETSPTTLYIINDSASRGARTAYRWPAAADAATAFHLGSATPDAVSLGGVEVWSSGPSVPIIFTTTLNAVTEDEAFSQQISASGNPTPTFTVTAGTITSGLSLSSGGLISGTPDTPGAYDFTVTATNTEGSDVQQYTGTVAAAAIAPTITTTTLSSATEDDVFSQQLVATGDATITFAVTAGTIIPGLSLSSSGLLSGTPTTPGAYDFTVTATNGAGSDDQQYTGTVAAVGVAGDPLTTIGADPLTTTGADPLTTAA